VTSIGTVRTYAGVWPRFTALVADIILMSCVFFPVIRIVKGTWLMSASDHDWVRGWFVSDPLCLSFLVVMFLYFVLLEGLGGATVGKRLMRLRQRWTRGTGQGAGPERPACRRRSADSGTCRRDSHRDEAGQSACRGSRGRNESGADRIRLRLAAVMPGGRRNA
jgi:hypothetical protein